MKSAAWADPARWDDICVPAGCPICQAGKPRDVIAESESTWVTAAREAQLPGYACVVSKRHVVEPFELTEPDGVAFWAEAMRAARVLAELTEAVKMNYGIHGNVIPHLHLHLWPRFVDDPYDTGGIPAPGQSFTRSNDDLRRMAVALQSAYARPTG
jgi:diadenosine tetraphosphate (Ap4A) HIT family hydrolase